MSNANLNIEYREKHIKELSAILLGYCLERYNGADLNSFIDQSIIKFFPVLQNEITKESLEKSIKEGVFVKAQNNGYYYRDILNEIVEDLEIYLLRKMNIKTMLRGCGRFDSYELSFKKAIDSLSNNVRVLYQNYI